MIRSGLDWSGDAGDPKKEPRRSPRLVTVVAHIAVDDWDSLDSALDQARRERRLPEDFTFHFSDCRDGVRAAFFNAIGRVPFCAHACLFDKRLWPTDYIKATTGPGRIQDQIVQLIAACPDDVTSNQTLLIDGEKLRGGKIPSVKTEINRRLAQLGRHRMRKVKYCPDDASTEGPIIQVADMLAGALHDAGEVKGPYLSLIGTKITLT